MAPIHSGDDFFAQLASRPQPFARKYVSEHKHKDSEDTNDQSNVAAGGGSACLSSRFKCSAVANRFASIKHWRPLLGRKWTCDSSLSD